MELLNTFAVDLPAQQMWEVLTDPERVIPCLPGAALSSVNGDEFEGAIKVKLGPVSLQYEGTGRFVDRDDSVHSIVIKGVGKDARGQGNVSVSITLSLSEHGSGTEARVLTDLGLSGRAAQFGRGVIGDVSNKLLAQFVHNLEQAVAGSLSESAPQQVKTIQDVEPLDVADTMGGLLFKYLLPAAGIGGVAVVGAMIAIRTRRRSSRRGPRMPDPAQRITGHMPQQFSALVTLIPQGVCNGDRIGKHHPIA